MGAFYKQRNIYLVSTKRFLLHFLPLDTQTYMYVSISWSKIFYIYGKFHADNGWSQTKIQSVCFILTIIIRHPRYWNYCHNLFLFKYFHKTCTDMQHKHKVRQTRRPKIQSYPEWAYGKHQRFLVIQRNLQIRSCYLLWWILQFKQRFVA